MLYQTVGHLGLTKAQVRGLLPSWWAPEIEAEEAGVAELGLYLSRRLSIDLTALFEGRVVPKGAVSQVAFKHRSGTAPEKFVAATYIAASLAKAILDAFPVPYTPLPGDPEALRDAARAQGNERVVGFDSLLALCWNSGIPVIPLPHLPIGVRKMDGAALRVGPRPVIVIAKRQSSRAWLSFILAHEIGHLALGHLAPGSTLIDVALHESATYATDSAQDAEERAADQFALNALGGPDLAAALATWSARESAPGLAVAARRLGQALGIEPGHIVLRHAFESKRWAEATNALRFLSEDFDPASRLLDQLRAQIELDRLAGDVQELVENVTGLAHVAA
jgi:hypothetical protein